MALADKGADVAITYERSADRAAEVVRAIEGKGRKALAIQADSADPAAVKRSVDEAAEALGGLDILVNNVGIARFGAFVDMSLADIDALLNVNVRSPVLASQAAIPHLGKGGRIITIGSNAGRTRPFPGLAGYSLTKSALLGLTRHLARELGPQDITVNLVQPGPTDTDMNPADGDLAAGARPDGARPLRRAGRRGGRRGVPRKPRSEPHHRVHPHGGRRPERVTADRPRLQACRKASGPVVRLNRPTGIAATSPGDTNHRGDDPALSGSEYPPALIGSRTGGREDKAFPNTTGSKSI